MWPPRAARPCYPILGRPAARVDQLWCSACGSSSAPKTSALKALQAGFAHRPSSGTDRLLRPSGYFVDSDDLNNASTRSGRPHSSQAGGQPMSAPPESAITAYCQSNVRICRDSLAWNRVDHDLPMEPVEDAWPASPDVIRDQVQSVVDSVVLPMSSTSVLLCGCLRTMSHAQISTVTTSRNQTLLGTAPLTCGFESPRGTNSGGMARGIPREWTGRILWPRSLTSSKGG